MIVLGINGGLSMPYENMHFFGPGENHDAAAALIIDGEIVGAIEEERLNRIKHTNKFPVNAIKAVLNGQKIELDDIDYFAVYATEDYIERLLKRIYWRDSSIQNLLSPRECIIRLFEKAFNYKINEQKICFVDHHMAHAASCYHLSGFDESLILTIDGEGCDISGRVLHGINSEMINIDTISRSNSLGHYYYEVIKFIGYSDYEEYKVMGLAPYGNPEKFRDVFSLFYNLLPEGRFEINLNRVGMLYSIGRPRRKGQKFDQLYKDVAASLQESLEKIVLHVLEFYSKKNGCDKLCLAGGVAHNCSANGKILYSGLFKEIFVQPAAHDAGNSIGSAIYTYINKCNKKVKKLEHVFIGTNLEGDPGLFKILNAWKSFINFKIEDNIEKRTAELISNGKIIGWVQGKSEFGPRALGNRSIIADPRPEKNKYIINKMVKKREAFRPFAPSVIEEKSREFFEIGSKESCFDYMTFVVKVKKEYQELLGAITHVDGTARIQTVNKPSNPKYWNLINEFSKLSGVPILLNTSFNNNVEPIVNTAEDAIVCFLTTGLDCLVIGNYIITKKNDGNVHLLNDLVPNFFLHTILNSKNSFDSFDSNKVKYEIGFNYSSKYNHEISKDVFNILSNVDGKMSLEELISKQLVKDNGNKTKILKEVESLWGLRYINLSPSPGRFDYGN